MNKKTLGARILSIVLIIFICAPVIFPIFEPLWTSFIESGNNPFDYARITELEYKAVLLDEPDNSGKLVVTERITFDIHAASKDNLFWELWRDLPEFYVDGVKVGYNVISVKELTDEGGEIVYDESHSLYWEDDDYLYGPRHWYHSEGPYDEYALQYECVFFYVDGIYRDEVTFELVYEINNAALKYNDSSELYISLYDGDTIKFLESFKGEILIPNKDMPQPGNYTANTYGTNNHDFPFTESDTLNPGYHTFIFDLDKDDLKFKPYNKYLEFSLVSFGEDKHIFTQFARPNNHTYNNELSNIQREQIEYETLPQIFQIKKIKTFVICSGLSLLIIAFTLISKQRINKKYTFFKPQQKFQEYRDIPSDLDPIFAAHLVLSRKKIAKNIIAEYSPLLLSLVRKKYVELAKIDESKDWTDSNVKIVIKYTPPHLINTSNSLIKDFNQQLIQPGQTVISEYSSTLGQTVVTVSNSETQNAFENSDNPDLQNIPLVLDSSAPNLEKLTPNEEQFFNLLLRHCLTKQVSLESFQNSIYYDCDYTHSFVQNVYKSVANIGITNGYLQKLNYDEPQQKINTKANLLFFVGIVILTVANYLSYKTRLDLAFGAFTILAIVTLICAKILKNDAKKYTLLTQFGEDEYEKWNGLYNYLKNESFIKDASITEISVLEKYLVYATAFGLSDKVTKILSLKIPAFENSEIYRIDYFRRIDYHRFNKSLSYRAHSASHISISGGHGGYGGGGRGGGGGGGGH